MKCKKCNSPIPQRASKCNNCLQKSGYALGTKPFPDCDMYENQVVEFETDPKKKSIRESYIKTLPEYNKIEELQKKGWNTVGKVFALIFCIMPCVVVMSLIGIFISIHQNIALGVILIVLSVASAIIIGAVMMKKIISKDKPRIIAIKQIKTHDNKLRYYFNNFIIGYSVLDHTTSDDNGTTYYYAFYEVDKRNIESIGYDSYFAEYILYLKRPVYTHYDFKPTKEFRVADIFSDLVLTQVFGCDLPPKYMPY